MVRSYQRLRTTPTAAAGCRLPLLVQGGDRRHFSSLGVLLRGDGWLPMPRIRSHQLLASDDSIVLHRRDEMQPPCLCGYLELPFLWMSKSRKGSRPTCTRLEGSNWGADRNLRYWSLR